MHMRPQIQRIGDLDCRIVRSKEGAPEILVVLCHGYGAPGDDLVPLAGALLRTLPSDMAPITFAFPEAPLSLDFGGFGGARAWWHLDVEAIMEAERAGRARDLSGSAPPGLAPARERLSACVAALQEMTGCGPEQLVLGGFSQGAMLTTDLALRMPIGPQLLAILSGTLVDAASWRELAPKKRSMPVLISHGDHDPLLPFAMACALRDQLIADGLDVSFVPFHGPHAIARPALERFAELIREHL